jgi:MYXO-CTERM domain-containing protein
MRRLLLSVSLVASLFVAAPAHATAEFPGLIVSHLNIVCSDGGTPIWDGNGCTICHLTNNGGLGTVQHPFGANLKAEGLSAFNDSELTKLLDEQKTALDDFNCDGIPDIQELESCEWPALVTLGDKCDAGPDGGDGGVPTENIIYGCSTSTGPQGSSALPASVAAALAAMLTVAVVRRRRRIRPS